MGVARLNSPAADQPYYRCIDPHGRRGSRRAEQQLAFELA